MLRVATRGSALARRQAETVVQLLGTPPHEFVIVTTTGDTRSDVPIHALGGQGVFVKEVQAALIDGRADIAVHSAKDLPAHTPDELVIGAIPERADPRDALVGMRFDDLPRRARVGTGAPRRRAQLRAARPDLEFAELRGNIDTRLAKAVDFDAVVVALAALDRLGRRSVVADVLPTEVMVPQVGQGALAVECRVDDEATIEQLTAIDDPASRRAVTAERLFLAELGGGCDAPVGAYATIDEIGTMTLVAFLEIDGWARRAELRGRDPARIAREAAAALREARR